MDNKLRDKVIAIIASEARLTPETIGMDASLEELGIDSLGRLNILFELESEFDIDIPDDDARGIKTVREMVERLELYLQSVANRKEA
jgi:acyl carrier protein